MKGKIDINGGLKIDRCDIWQEQHCMHGEENPCTDGCPQFGEPSSLDHGGKIQLQICQGRVLYFDELIDERV